MNLGISVGLFFLISSFNGYNQSIVGQWKTIDDDTGKARSIVDIYEIEGEFFGKISGIYTEPGEDTDPICTECTDDRKNKKVIGMEIIRNLVFDESNNTYEDGEILDPESGNVYDSKLWVDKTGNLKVRGYIMFVFRTQTWLPYDG